MQTTLSTLQIEIRKNLKHNLIVNLLDGGFFGFGIGFASFITIIPLFVSQMTDSAILIGLIPAIHSVGWQLPQLLAASWVSRMKRYKPAVLMMTIHERIPFFGLAAVSWFFLGKNNSLALTLTFILLIWQGLGGGLAANPWQSMMAKIIPARHQGSFFGGQAALANLAASISAILAGIVLSKLKSPQDFTWLFLLGGISLIISLGIIALTREPEDTQKVNHQKKDPFWLGTRTIWRRDVNFRGFMFSRVLMQFATMGYAFYIVYCTRYLDMDVFTAGVLTSVLMISQIVANPVMGWFGDRLGHHTMLKIGIIASVISGVLAWWATSLIWFYPVMILAGISIVAVWTTSLTMSVQFGTEAHRPTYIGMANTMLAPATLLAPIFGGWLADAVSYQTTFLASAGFGIITLIALQIFVKNPLVIEK
ncbi:MAG: MFS transporter [Anaerolineales bacterium]|uniref:MFS transporter n=1 Tax=Candidatus Desulfolinea nitratireducens TaxID=2841698 RepID=A0A8J6NNC9_9CHLR|nr:MFS transporter [Candidatus Desulfolinea nitratireducens]